MLIEIFFSPPHSIHNPSESTHTPFETTGKAIESPCLLIEATCPAIEAVHTAIEATCPAIEAVHAVIEAVGPVIEAVHTAIEAVHAVIEAVHTAIESLRPAIESLHLAIEFTCRLARAACLPFLFAEDSAEFFWIKPKGTRNPTHTTPSLRALRHCEGDTTEAIQHFFNTQSSKSKINIRCSSFNHLLKVRGPVGIGGVGWQE